MNKEFVDNFIKRAQAAGLSQKQAETFIAKELDVMRQKEASEVDGLITSLLGATYVQKTAETVAYTEGVLKAAVEKGCNVQQASEIAKIALSRIAPQFKQQAPQMTAKQASYGEGFMKAAMARGLSQQQAYSLLKQSAGPNPTQGMANDPTDPHAAFQENDIPAPGSSSDPRPDQGMGPGAGGMYTPQPYVGEDAPQGGPGAGPDPGMLQQLLQHLGPQQLQALIGGGGGALAGGLGGYAAGHSSNPKKDHGMRDGILGALLGGGAGAAAGGMMGGQDGGGMFRQMGA